MPFPDPEFKKNKDSGGKLRIQKAFCDMFCVLGKTHSGSLDLTRADTAERMAINCLFLRFFFRKCLPEVVERRTPIMKQAASYEAAALTSELRRQGTTFGTTLAAPERGDKGDAERPLFAEIFEVPWRGPVR